MKEYWFWFDTKWACGALVCNENGIVIKSCPIYRKKFVGRHFREIEVELNSKNLLRGYQLIYVSNK